MRSASAPSDTPVDCAHIITRLVFAQLIKTETGAAPSARLFAGAALHTGNSWLPAQRCGERQQLLERYRYARIGVLLSRGKNIHRVTR